MGTNSGYIYIFNTSMVAPEAYTKILREIAFEAMSECGLKALKVMEIK